uniref:Uncharacterized protein n=1 Tax=Arundo donax TaxID=35708 RepID=A0A0A9B3Q5_ARUDO
MSPHPISCTEHSLWVEWVFSKVVSHKTLMSTFMIPLDVLPWSTLVVRWSSF